MFARTGEKFLSYYVVYPVRAKVIRGARMGELVDVVAVSGSDQTCVISVNIGGNKWPMFPKPVAGIEIKALLLLSNQCPMT